MSQMLCMAWNYLQISLVNLTNRRKFSCKFLMLLASYYFSSPAYSRHETVVEYNIFSIIYIHLKINIYFTRICKKKKKIKIYFVLVAYQITYSTFDCTIITIIIATLNITMLCSAFLAYFLCLKCCWCCQLVYWDFVRGWNLLERRMWREEKVLKLLWEVMLNTRLRNNVKDFLFRFLI